MSRSPICPDSVERRIRGHVTRNMDPFYYYDTGRIRESCGRFRSLPYEPKSIHFATMANSHPLFLRLIREERLGVFVNSVAHLQAARRLGFDGNEIAYAASAMDERTMREAQASGAMVNLDSIRQIEQWTTLCPDTPFGIRCNIGEMVTPRHTRGGYFIGKESRLGLLPDEIRSISCRSLVAGLHLYAGTDICCIAHFRECYEALIEFAPLFPRLEYVDFGGGFCLEDADGCRFDFETYGTMIGRVMDGLNDRVGRAIRMILEPGRIIGGSAGWFVCRVTDVKARAGRQLIGVNASSVQFPRPLFYPESARHPVKLLHAVPTVNGTSDLPSCIYGCSTYSRDFLARDVYLPEAQIGDIIVLGSAGSYCASSYTQFLGLQQPMEIYDDPEESNRKVGAKDLLRISP